ncbi:MAG: YraN family protein [Candidatus Omnitrophota bacterium]|nr:MAG: YraN family protein [Candidatus Omnitrophota bacterium]
MNRELGQWGEEVAVKFLRKKGCRIIAQNYASPWGEIDIIAKEKRCLVFVEVKTRSSSRFGLPQEAVDRRKQKQISKSALYYLSTHQLLNTPARFDVVSIFLHSDGLREINWFKDVFSLC